MHESRRFSERRNAHLVVETPAKVNLYLRVAGRRPDGYHDLETLMCPVGIHDRIVIRKAESGIRVECGHPDVPGGRDNIAHRAAESFFGLSGLNGGVHIDIEKNIPVGAGMGGGSSDAAGVLCGLNRLFGDPLEREVLHGAGLALGADVPFFVDCVPAWATGVGDVLEPVAGLYPHHLVVVYPGVVVNTGSVYKKFNLALTRCQKIHRLPEFNGEPSLVEELLCNDLETVTLHDFPPIARARKALVDAGARGALMSGSGSAVFGLFRSRPEAREAMDRLDADSGWRAYAAPLVV
ncbi:MAG: 4-(cytidine 5'-diphospho)-2-C-methyl-D-erythritol kinase [Desulfatibacillaceae bacterium]